MQRLHDRNVWGFRKPTYPVGLVEYAAKLHAQANTSDPFAGCTIAHYMRQGYELPSDVIAVARMRIAAHEAARREAALRQAAAGLIASMGRLNGRGLAGPFTHGNGSYMRH